MEGNHAFPDDLRARVDELAGLDLPDSPESPASQGAVELMTDLISNSGTRITILTLGPLTNLGEALGAEPALAQEIEMVYIMGGAVSVPGNLAFAGIDNQVSEWNIYIDPKAAQLVLDSGAPLTLIPLDVTNLSPLTVDFLDRLGEVAQTPEAEFVFRSLTQYSEFIAQGYYFWDPLAAAALTDEESFTFEALELQVILEDGSHSGQTIQQGEGASVRVAIGVDNRQFEQLLIDVLNSE